MTTFTGTKFNDAFLDSGLFDPALPDLMPGIAGNDAPTADTGDRSVALAAHESAARPHADRAMLLHGDFSSLVDTDGKAGTDTVVEAALVGGLKADSNEVAVEGLIGRDDDISLEPTRFENVTHPHANGAVLLHGDFSALVDTDAAIAAVTEELFGNYNFVRIEPTSSAPESVLSMVDGHGNDAKGVGLADGTSNTVVFAERYALSGAEGDDLLPGGGNGNETKIVDIVDGTSNTLVFAERHALFGAEGDDLLPGGGNGNETKIVDIVDGTSNTLAFATNGVVESVNVKYTLFSNGDDDPVAGAARLARADHGSDGGSLLDVGDLLFGLAADGGDGFVESAASAGVTRPHADGVVTDNKDPDTLATAMDDIYDGTSSTFVDGVDRSGNNALGTRGGGEVIGDFSSYVTYGTTGTVSDSGNDARIADITDGTSNTALDASSKEVAYAINAAGGWDPTSLFEFPRTEPVNGSTTLPIGFTDGTSNTVMFGKTDDDGMSNVVEDLSVKYTMFDEGRDVLLPGGNGADRLVHAADLGVHSVLHGGDVLDVGDALIGFDDAADNSNDSQQTRTAGGSTPLQADPDGQANGIIAVLIGLYADIPDPLNNGGLPLD